MADKVQSEPGVDVSRLPLGARLMIETENHVYEMVAVRPDLGLLQVTSSDPPLHQAASGQLIGSRPAQGGVVPGWIGKGLCMSFRFNNGTYFSTPVVSVEVQAATWHYVVF